MYKIKICGITNAADARLAVEAGADALGWNFYRRSRRFVSVDAAGAALQQLDLAVRHVGVFVDASVDEVSHTARRIGLFGVQLHGDEPPEMLAALPAGLPIVRAYRCGAAGLAPLAEFLEACGAGGRRPDAVLLDADAGQQYGGSGVVADWQQIADQRSMLGHVRLVLAGGLTPDNVADAIRMVRPDGVDVASGVESSPGKKDAARLREFVAAARSSFADVE